MKNDLSGRPFHKRPLRGNGFLSKDFPLHFVETVLHFVMEADRPGLHPICSVSTDKAAGLWTIKEPLERMERH